jgi:hypothetical protein
MSEGVVTKQDEIDAAFLTCRPGRLGQRGPYPKLFRRLLRRRPLRLRCERCGRVLR